MADIQAIYEATAASLAAALAGPIGSGVKGMGEGQERVEFQSLLDTVNALQKLQALTTPPRFVLAAPRDI